MHRGLRICAVVLLMVLVLIPSALAETICQLGDTGDHVRVVQVRLKSLGYSDENPVAPYRFTATTKAGVALFQIGNGLPNTGVVDAATYKALTASTAISYDEYIEILKDAQHVLGGSGTYVRETKQRLKALGYFKGSTTLKYDSKTVKAVKLFQTANALPADGIANRATRAVLFSDNAISLDEYQKEGDRDILKLGSRGTAVLALQNALKALGYYTDTVNGVYGKTTQEAVSIFQEANGLTVTGNADATTRTLLNGNCVTYAEYAAAQALRQVALGDTGLAVKLLQERLTALYYYEGTIDGSFSITVRSAVMRFQDGNGVNAKGTQYYGVATVATRRAMNAQSAVDRVEAEGLLPGDEIEPVATMTKRLLSLGYLTSAPAKYTSAVKSAVALFQKANDLTSSGIATPLTLDTLYSKNAISYDEYKNGSGNARIEKMIKVATGLLGAPYSTNAVPPKSFDCSRFTRYCLNKVGISVSGEVESQGKSLGKQYGKITALSALKRGDLLFFNTQTDKNPGHSAIYLGIVNGKGRFIHASSSAGKVVVTELKEWYRERFEWGVRIWQ